MLLKSAFVDDICDSGKRSLPYAMGIMCGNEPGHAMNLIALSDGDEPVLKFIEPQESRFTRPLKSILDDIFLIFV